MGFWARIPFAAHGGRSLEPTRTVERRLGALGRLPRPLSHRALLAALNSGEPGLVGPLGQALLEHVALECGESVKSLSGKLLGAFVRPSSRWTASTVLAARFAALSPELQRLALSFEGIPWAEVSSAPDFPADPLARQSLALHAALTGRPLVAAGLVGALGDPNSDAALAAESALQVLAVAAAPILYSPVLEVFETLRLSTAFPNLDRSAWQTPVPEDRAILFRCVADACMAFEAHRRRGPMLAAMILLDRAAVRERDSVLSAWFGRLDHPSHAALRGALRWCRLPIAGVRAWEWLSREDLAPSAVDRLSRISSVVEHDAIHSRAALALRPRRAKRLAEIDLPREPSGRTQSAEHLIPARGMIPLLSPAARRGLPRIAAMLRGSPKSRLALLEPLLADPDPIARHALVRNLPLRSLADVCLDADLRVARSAYLSWSHAAHLSDSRQASPSPEHQRLVKLLTRSPHEAIRTMAAGEHAELNADSTHSLAGRLKLRLRLKRDRESVISYLASQIMSSDASTRQQTIMLVRRLDLSQRLERELTACALSGVDAEANSPVARSAASAVAALSDLSSDPSGRAIAACLKSRDARLRANAVEAIARRSRRRPLATLSLPDEFVGDAHHRVRGNAVRAQITTADPATAVRTSEGLMRMLADDREMHRAAGAWAAGGVLRASGRERLGDKYPVVLARVCEMAQFDESPAVRRRALLAAAQAQTELRAIITGDDDASSQLESAAQGAST